MYCVFSTFSYLFVGQIWLRPKSLPRRGIKLAEFKYNREKQALLLTEKPSLTEKHVIGSVAKKPPQSVFTRAQRVSVCFSIFFLMTTANAMFYQTGGNKNTNFTLTLAFLTVKWTQLYSSVMSILIVYPPILVMAEMFRRSRYKKVIICDAIL